LVYLAESCAKGHGFKCPRLSLRRLVHRYEPPRGLGHRELAAALEVAEEERSASEGGPYRELGRGGEERTASLAELWQAEGGPYKQELEGRGEERTASLAELRRAEDGPYRAEFEEVTLEADPETIEAKKAAEWAHAGINRVSFGVQSFSDKELAAAGRMHRRADIYRAVPILHEAGIRNISFDLIAGLPHQTRERWRQSLEELTALAPEHVSVYLLEVDEGSRLGKELLAGGARYSAGAVPSEDEMAEFYAVSYTHLTLPTICSV